MDDGASTLMSIRDAAQATGLSPKALRRRIERGTLASVMIGGRRRIPMEALARRGLIASGHESMSGHLLLDRSSPAVQAVAQHLYRLESRVAALEAVLGVSGPARAGDAQGPDSNASQPLAAHRPRGGERHPPTPRPGDAIGRHALDSGQGDRGDGRALATQAQDGSQPVGGALPPVPDRHAIVAGAHGGDLGSGNTPATAAARARDAQPATPSIPASSITTASGPPDGVLPAAAPVPVADDGTPAVSAASDGSSA